MKLDLNTDWKALLKAELHKPYFETLMDFVASEYQEGTCFPPKHQIFAAMNHCAVAAVKLVILGQDPYHGAAQANGLCFSVGKTVKIPPSLHNIFKELMVDQAIEMPTSGDLTHWADQGVLLLNATLTVREGQAGSHQKMGWETFTDAIIKSISTTKKGVVFLLWGGYAKKKKKLIDTNLHYILESGHPSPLSANRGFWFGNKHFSKANALLEKQGVSPVYW